jgi:hypothetical protein
MNDQRMSPPHSCARTPLVPPIGVRTDERCDPENQFSCARTNESHLQIETYESATVAHPVKTPSTAPFDCYDTPAPDPSAPIVTTFTVTVQPSKPGEPHPAMRLKQWLKLGLRGFGIRAAWGLPEAIAGGQESPRIDQDTHTRTETP